MGKLFYPIKKDQWKSIASELSRAFLLPEINHNLAIYFETKKQSLEIGFINNKCYLRGRDRNSSKSTPNIWIENMNIKFLLKILDQLGLNTATINEIIQLDFREDEALAASLQLGTILGDLLVINGELKSKISDILKIESSDFMDNENLDNLIANKHVPSDRIFNKLNTPNPKIQNYTDKFAIDLLSGITTISHKISAKSNDYSIYEEYFENLTHSKLDSDQISHKDNSFFKPISIIIPCLDSEKTILKTLFSIESQDIDKDNKTALDVIIIDDGSKKRISNILKPFLNKFTFKPRVIRLEQNHGLSAARNMGFQLSAYNHVLFIDSDVLLSKNFLYEHSIRLQLIPNSLFMSFKENIEPDNELAKVDTISKGLPVSTNINDKRILRMIEKDTRWPNKTVNEGTEELLSESNLFKNFGYGRTINGCFDLPSMVVGHNMSTRKDIINSVGGFGNHFSGWGLEDTYFGAKIISNGNFIIPVLTTSVYHINHPSRSGSMEKQLSQHKNNTETYNKLIHQKL